MADWNRKVLITGANGQLGAELAILLGDQAVPLTRQELDLAEIATIPEVIRCHRPSTVINCAAYTAVDQAEEEPGHCLRINAEAVRTLAEACDEAHAILVQISTDYVFGQEDIPRTPRGEEDEIYPQGVYARSKHQGELAAAEAKQHLIMRTCGLYAGGPSQKNFVETMLRLGVQRDELSVVNDQTCTPSYARHVAQAILDLLGREQRGLFHVVNRGETTWFDLARTIFELADLPVKVSPITTAQFGARAPRPVYSVLSTAKFEAAGCEPLPTWQEALKQYLHERKSRLAAQG